MTGNARVGAAQARAHQVWAHPAWGATEARVARRVAMGAHYVRAYRVQGVARVVGREVQVSWVQAYQVRGYEVQVL